ncbi:ABC-2 family transporter protein [Patescibacteria group bacterium]|nr:ABC-2 family transporter protein [Patescibacteria group bacterium]
MKKYLVVFSNALQSLTEYRVSLLLDVTSNLISSLVLYLFWRFLAGSGLDIAPYNQVTIGFYFLLVAAVSTLTGFDTQGVSQDIREGDITQHILKPINYMWIRFFNSLPDKFLKVTVAVAIIATLWLLGFRLDINLFEATAFMVVLALAMLGNYLIYFTSGLLSFWTMQTLGLTLLVSIGSSLVSGSVIPLELVPPLFIAISKVLPFRYFLFFPVQILLGKVPPEQIITGILIQIIWIVTLYLLSILVWKRGIRRLEAVGI